MEQAEIEAQKPSHTDGPLDPMIRGLLGFVQHGDLSARIHKIFQRMDLDENGGISLQELNAGLKKLFHNSKDSCQLTPEDFEQITSFGDLTDEHDELALGLFETMRYTRARHQISFIKPLGQALGVAEATHKLNSSRCNLRTQHRHRQSHQSCNQTSPRSVQMLCQPFPRSPLKPSISQCPRRRL